MKISIFAFTRQGRETARRIRSLLEREGDSVSIRVPVKLADCDCLSYAGSLTAAAGEAFAGDALIFVGACGIAVRAISPHVQNKRCDPAVLCLDERVEFVIPLLSGHIGGANRWARRLANGLSATAVMNTATDVNGRFSVDDWAAAHGFYISDMALAKRVSAEILEQDIPIWLDVPQDDQDALWQALPAGLCRGKSGPLGICVSVRDMAPFDHTLLLIPKALRVGIGCRRGIAREAIAAAVNAVFHENGLRLEAVREAASIDLKADEDGLKAYCHAMGWPIRFYPAEALNAVQGKFSASAFVREHAGVDNVCERAAVADGGTLIVPKTARDGVTVAVSEMKWGMSFV